MKAEIGSFGGAPAVFLDGKPVTALMHWTRNPQSADTVLFRNEGVHFYSFMGNLAIPAPEGTPEEELEIKDGGLPRMLLTPENIDKLMTQLVADDPEIKILPRIIMNPPVWWDALLFVPEAVLCRRSPRFARLRFLAGNMGKTARGNRPVF